MILPKIANNKGADQTARMRRLVCASVVRKPPKTGFLASRQIFLDTMKGQHIAAIMALIAALTHGLQNPMYSLIYGPVHEVSVLNPPFTS